MALSVLQINLMHSKLASVEVNRCTSDIALITEPHCYKGQVKLDKATGEILYATCPRPRACIRVKHGLQAWKVDRFCDEDMTTIALLTEEKEVIYLASIYLDILLKADKQNLTNLINECNNNDIPLTMGIDSNAHSGLWGSKDTNERGGGIEDIIMSNKLTLVNKGSIPTFVRGASKTIIDITLQNSSENNLFTATDWQVDTANSSASDHRYVKFKCGGRYNYDNKKARNYKKAKWAIFKEILSQYNPDFEDESCSIDDLAADLEEAITEALEAACPLRPLTQ